MDRTLKDASEIQFLHSLSDIAPGSSDAIALLNHGHTVDMKLTDVRLFSSTEQTRNTDATGTFKVPFLNDSDDYGGFNCTDNLDDDRDGNTGGHGKEYGHGGALEARSTSGGEDEGDRDDDEDGEDEEGGESEEEGAK